MEHSRRSIIDHYDSLASLGPHRTRPAQMAVVQKLDALSGDAGQIAAGEQIERAGLAVRRRASRAPPQGPLHLGIGRARQDHADGPVLRAPWRSSAKRRVHFHAFMADVHARIFAWRQKLKKAGEVKGDDPIAPIADASPIEAWLLCFDEFARHRHRRRHDPRPAVPGAVRRARSSWSPPPTSIRPISTRTA